MEAQGLPTYTQLFLSAAAAVTAGILLAIYGVTDGFLCVERFLQGAMVHQLDLLYSGGFLGSKNLLGLLPQVKNYSHCGYS